MKEPLWSYSQVAAAVGASDAPGPVITGVGIDSRLIVPGDLFIALTGDPGPRFTPSSRSDRDGHDFASDAVARGAVAVLVHRGGDYGVPAVLVEDSLDALWDLGRAARRRLDCPVVAVTGSSGKTTFKSFAATAINAFATSGSLNNHLGVPLSLARTPKDSTAAVYEIGTNHPGEIAPLARLVSPDVAVLLNVHPAHIENFSTLEAIRREKVSIAEGLVGGGTFVHPVGLGTDLPGPSLTFGDQPEADVRLVEVQGSTVMLRTPAGEVGCPVPGGGVHRAMSVCAVAATLVALERPLALLERLAEVDVPRGRGSRIEVAGVTVIDDSYNANPASMAVTLEAFSSEPGRRIAILGDMRELGEETERYHAELVDRCAPLDGVICVGEAIRALYDRLPPGIRLGFAERADQTFAARCAAELVAGDRVLVKGSNTVFWVHNFVDRLVEALAGQSRQR